MKLKKVDDFLVHFDWWCKPENQGWYEAYAPGYPSHDNSLEATNRVLKVDGGVRDSMLMEDWLESMEVKVLEPWSKYRNDRFTSTKKVS